jgi:hypothetical protein
MSNDNDDRWRDNSYRREDTLSDVRQELENVGNKTKQQLDKIISRLSSLMGGLVLMFLAVLTMLWLIYQKAP